MPVTVHPVDVTASCPCGTKPGDRSVPAALLIAVLQQMTTAATDARTGLLTHDAWQPAARRVVAEHASCALLIIDIDHVKRVNDTHGHLGGDRLIAAVAEEVRRVAGEHGVAGRFGGDEFVALLPDADHASALQRAEHLRQRVATLAVFTDETGRRTVRVTVSIGLTLTTPGVDLTDALWRADAALYAAKAAGRNTVRSADPA